MLWLLELRAITRTNRARFVQNRPCDLCVVKDNYRRTRLAVGPKECRLTPQTRAAHEKVFYDPALRGSISWHMAGRVLLEAGLLEPADAHALTTMTRATSKPTSRDARRADK